MEGISTIVHAVLVVFLIIELGLTAYLVSRAGGNESRTNFMLFNSIWTLIVVVPYTGLVKRAFSSLYHTIVGLALLAITAIFWFAGSIAIAVKFPVHCHFHDCRVAQAATAFGFFIWAITTGLTAIEALGSRSGSAV